MKTTMNTATLELRNLSHRYMTEGLMVAGLFHILVIGGVQFLLHSSNSGIAIDEPLRKRFREIYIQPTIWDRPVMPNVSVAQSVRTNIGTPVPVPEAEINPEATIPTQIEMNNPTGVEKYPEIISNPSPKYPELARRSGIEGTVYIKMWVTKEGKVKQAEIIKSTSVIFDQNAIDAALSWKFTPAIMNNGPVSVWVTVPFKFRLD
jgi:TonB family protein